MADEAISEQETGGGFGCLMFLVIIVIIVAIGFGIAECHKTTFEKCIEQTAPTAEARELRASLPDERSYRMILEHACNLSIESGWRPD